MFTTIRVSGSEYHCSFICWPNSLLLCHLCACQTLSCPLADPTSVFVSISSASAVLPYPSSHFRPGGRHTMVRSGDINLSRKMLHPQNRLYLIRFMVSQTVFSLTIFGRDTTSKFTNFPDLWPTVQRKLCNMRPLSCTSMKIREDQDCRKQLVDMKLKMDNI